MKEVTMFYLARCPHCKNAKAILDELLTDSKYEDVSVIMVEESQQPEIANAHDYYYVPTFYVQDEKICEGVLTREQVQEVLDKAIA